MKACSKCGVVKALDAFNLRASSRDGRRTECRECQSTYSVKRYASDPVRFKAAVLVYASENASKVKDDKHRRYLAQRSTVLRKCADYYQAKRVERDAYRQKYRAKNPEKERAWSRASREKAPEKNAARTARRNAWKLRATPTWADLDLVAAFYVIAAEFTRSTGVPHQVDHIEPLRGRHVCGLHNEFNLQVLPAKVNAAKGNRPSDVQGVR